MPAKKPLNKIVMAVPLEKLVAGIDLPKQHPFDTIMQANQELAKQMRATALVDKAAEMQHLLQDYDPVTGSDVLKRMRARRGVTLAQITQAHCARQLIVPCDLAVEFVENKALMRRELGRRPKRTETLAAHYDSHFLKSFWYGRVNAKDLMALSPDLSDRTVYKVYGMMLTNKANFIFYRETSKKNSAMTAHQVDMPPVAWTNEVPQQNYAMLLSARDNTKSYYDYDALAAAVLGVVNC